MCEESGERADPAYADSVAKNDHDAEQAMHKTMECETRKHTIDRTCHLGILMMLMPSMLRLYKITPIMNALL